MSEPTHAYVSIPVGANRASTVYIDRPSFLTEQQMKTTLWTAKMGLDGSVTLSPGSFGAKFRAPARGRERWMIGIVITGAVHAFLGGFYKVTDVDTITGGTIRLGLERLRDARRHKRTPKPSAPAPEVPVVIDVSELKRARDVLNEQKRLFGPQMEMSVDKDGLLSVTLMVSL